MESEQKQIFALSQNHEKLTSRKQVSNCQQNSELYVLALISQNSNDIICYGVCASANQDYRRIQRTGKSLMNKTNISKCKIHEITKTHKIYLPIQINEEKDQVISKANNCISHVSFELPHSMNFSWVIHSKVSLWNLHIPGTFTATLTNDLANYS